MSKLLTKINGVPVYECDYDNWRDKFNINGLTAEGMCFRFAMWLKNVLGYEEDAEDVYNNTSGIRDGSRLDIHDNYTFSKEDDLQISFLYYVNGNVWAALVKDGDYFGEIEIPITC